jgi:excisionase family DNA binding protein
MTVKEAAERLEISISLVYGLIAAGHLRCTRHGLGRGTIRVSEQQLGEYLKSREWGTSPDPQPVKRSFRHVRLP